MYENPPSQPPEAEGKSAVQTPEEILGAISGLEDALTQRKAIQDQRTLEARNEEQEWPGPVRREQELSPKELLIFTEAFAQALDKWKQESSNESRGFLVEVRLTDTTLPIIKRTLQEKGWQVKIQWGMYYEDDTSDYVFDILLPKLP